VVDLVITELGVFEIGPQGLTLTEVADGVTVQEIGRRPRPRSPPGRLI